MTAPLIHQLVFQSARKYPDRPAFWTRSEDNIGFITYDDLKLRVKHAAAGLMKIGLEHGQKVGIYSGNSPEWCIAYLAILAAGGVVVPLDQQLKYLELRNIILKSAMAYLFCSEPHLGELAELRLIADPHPEVIPLSYSKDEDLTLGKLIELGSAREYTPAKIEPHELAVLIFTSGTSGESKGVMLSHANITSDVEAIKPVLKIGHEDRFLSVLPLHHTFEATCGFLYVLSIGASIVYSRSLKSAQIAEDIKSMEITLMCGVPLLWEKMYLSIKRGLAKRTMPVRLYVALGVRFAYIFKDLFNLRIGKMIFKSLRKKAALGSVRMFVSGGAAIDPHVSRFFCALGIDLLQGYGLTETSPVVSVNVAEDNRFKTVGRPLPGTDLKVIDPDANGIGEIVVKGKMVMLGYYQNDGATKSVLKDGYLHTGDLGFVDRAGFLHITGRKKNVIITPAGKNIYPEEIEAALELSSYILESAVLPRKKGTGEEPVAVVVPDYETIILMPGNQGGVPSDQELNKIMKAEVARICADLADYKRIKDVIVMTEELPKTAMRKIKKYVLIDTLQKLGQL